jgi:predicted RNA-binding Zn ribbon-like protein
MVIEIFREANVMAVAAKRKFDLTLTGQLSLDFVNTVEWRGSEQPQELLNSYADLLRWSEHSGALTAREAKRLAQEAERHPNEAERVWRRAIILRETLFRIFAAAAADRHPSPSDVDFLNAKLARALANLQLAPSKDGFVWTWKGEDDLERMLWAVARAAGELLTSDALKQLRECAGDKCRWLFIDTSRNKSRRWCMMNVCGNRAKARRHYEQMKSKSSE